MTVSYGRIEALHGISLSVEDGELVTLIGANGAGKSTTLRSINGLNHAIADVATRARAGKLRLDDFGIRQQPATA